MSNQKKLTDKQRADLLKDYKKFMPVQKISDKYGIHQQTVIRTILKAGLPEPAERKKLQAEKLNAEVVRLLKSGAQRSEVAEQFGISEGRVRLLATQHGMSREHRHQKIVALAKSGHAKTAIAAMVGVHNSTVHRVLKAQEEEK